MKKQGFARMMAVRLSSNRSSARSALSLRFTNQVLPLVSLLGMLFLLGVAYALSSNRRVIRLRTVGGAFAIQVAIGAFVLYSPVGRVVLETVSDGVQAVINCSNAGISFLFGGLVSDEMFEVFPQGTGFIFAFRVLPVIIFFSSLIAVLYYLRLMQLVITVLGGALQFVLGTSRTESLSATANIFVGQTEAPLVVKPYIATMTRSELFAIMCGGLASVAGSVLAGYAGMGVELKHLLAACFMAAPGGLLFAKLMEPETETPKDQSLAEADETGNEQDAACTDSADDDPQPVNVLDAAALGAASGLKLALNVGAMLLAFISLIALLNGLVGLIASGVGYEDVTIEQLLGYLFAPLAWLVGVPWDESIQGGSFIGQKLILNEFVAYDQFVKVKDSLSPKTQAIITFALCGFANFSSIAILLGGLGGMAPSRRTEIAQMGLRAVIAGTLANLMSAAIAGLFFSLS